jgi:RNA polymerase sigma-70 factor (ECF subfamily)
MTRVQTDDTDAFAQLYSRHSARALQVARAVCHDTGRAEEAVQEGFLSIWRNRASFQPELGNFKTWSMRIVQNRAIDSYRSAAAHPERLIAAPEGNPREPTASPQDEVIALTENDALRASLLRLPAAQAEVIGLAFFGGLTHTEIATQLELPQGTVKGRMRLGLEKLRGQLDEPG